MVCKSPPLQALKTPMKHQERQDNLCYYVDWKLDIEKLDMEAVAAYCEDFDFHPSNPIGVFHDLTILMSAFVASVLRRIDNKATEFLAPHLQRYVAWMRLQQAKLVVEAPQIVQSELTYSSLDIDKQATLCTSPESVNKHSELVVRVGRSLPSIINGVADPLEILFIDSLI